MALVISCLLCDNEAPHSYSKDVFYMYSLRAVVSKLDGMP